MLRNPQTPNVLMVFPRFNPNSFWSLKPVCEIWGARAPQPPLGMITVAAMLPRDWNVRLVNRNFEELPAADLEWADMVMTGGMVPQRDDALAVIDLAHSFGKPVVIGGPDVTSSPELFRSADFQVLGEAEGVIDDFVKAWLADARSGVFDAEKFTADVTKTPVPRYDLINLNDFLYIGVQFSRGCPFNCEFCDIIELFGRVPRAKTNAQMLAELDALYAAGYRGHVDFVDDNLIGNKKALKRFLPDLCEWQRKRGFPFQLSTSASMNLADDPELLAMLHEANFFGVFIGIESPDPATLISMQKKQNTRRSLADSVHKVYAAGMFVVAGFIVGFDNEKEAMAETMIDCIEATDISSALVGLLTALPSTQLSRRLEREGRMLPLATNLGDQCIAGLNFVTLRPRREVLADFRAVLQSVYDPVAFFARVRRTGRALGSPRKSSLSRLRIKEVRGLARLVWAMGITRPDLRRYFYATVADCLLHYPRNFESVVKMCAMYLHLGSFAQLLIDNLNSQIADLDAMPAAEETRLQLAVGQ